MCLFIYETIMKQHLWNNRWIKSNFPFEWHRTTSGWKSSIFNRNSSAERGLKFIASGEDQMRRRRQTEAAREAQRTSLSTAKATSPTQRPQTCTEAVTKYYNYTANEKMEHRLTTFQKAMGRSSNAYWVREYNYLLRCNDRQKQLHDLYNARKEYIFPTDWGQPISLYTMSNIGFYSKLYFTMNNL